jgi:hypothetical protein
MRNTVFVTSPYLTPSSLFQMLGMEEDGEREASASSGGGAEGGEGEASLAATVSQLLKQVSGLERQITGLQTLNTLMASLHEKQEKVNTSLMDTHEKEMTSLKATSKKDRDAVTSLEREVACLRDKNAILCQDKEKLRTQLDKMRDDVNMQGTDAGDCYFPSSSNISFQTNVFLHSHFGDSN